MTLVTDASVTGWGEHMSNLQAQSLWTAHEAKLHIKVVEFHTMFLACQQFLPHVQGKTVHVLTNITRVVFYVNKQAQTASVRMQSSCGICAVRAWSLTSVSPARGSK